MYGGTANGIDGSHDLMRRVERKISHKIEEEEGEGGRREREWEVANKAGIKKIRDMGPKAYSIHMVDTVEK